MRLYEYVVKKIVSEVFDPYEGHKPDVAEFNHFKSDLFKNHKCKNCEK